jgi:hypothetical protein
MANQFVQIEVAVASISKREKFLVFGRTHGAVEIEIDSHADLGRVCVGTRVNVMVGLSDVKALESGNPSQRNFLGL